MFIHCFSLKSINLSSFKCDNVITAGGMFHNCESLESIDLSAFNPKNCESICMMFLECYSLKSLDLSSLNAHNIIYFNDISNNCPLLKKENIELSKNGLKLLNYLPFEDLKP